MKGPSNGFALLVEQPVSISPQITSLFSGRPLRAEGEWMHLVHGIEIFFLSAYTHLGCWKDTGNRAVPQMDGSDPRIRGAYQRRANAINKCYQVARERKMVLFAIQHGGWCAAAPNFKGYQKYGRANKCRKGKGGPWANDVYRITNPIRPALPKGRYIPKLQELDPLDTSFLI